MADCIITPLHYGKACIGKCIGPACADAKAVWVLAACEGAGMLFEKKADNTFSTPFETDAAPLTVQNLCNTLNESQRLNRFHQLIVVGSPVDIAWVHASLPAEVARKVIAELRYPLLANWFSHEQGIKQLKQALHTVVMN